MFDRIAQVWIVAALAGVGIAPSSASAAEPTPTAPVSGDDADRPARKARFDKPRAKAPVRTANAMPLDTVTTPAQRSPSVVSVAGDDRGPSTRPDALVGFARGLAQPSFVDRRRRMPRTKLPDAFGDTLRPGERFRFDVTFAGNPAGLAEAEIVRVEPDPRGGPPAGAPLIRIEGHARTSGVVSLLATVTDDMVTHVDASTGAAVSSVNVLHYSGWAPRRYKHRVTEQKYEGRGQLRIVDTKDDVPQKNLKRVPVDTFDPLSAMAWVRSLRLEKGESARAHVVDGTTLLRIEIESQGAAKLDSMPSIALAMGLRPEDTQRIAGTVTRVDRWDQAIPGKRVFKLRAWLSDDERRIPLVLESDMWVGAIRLELTAYDPPPNEAAGPAARVRAGGAVP